MHEPLVINLSGGLGNQLFQFWAGRQIAENTGCTVIYDPTKLKSHSTPRDLELSEFVLADSLPLFERNSSKAKALNSGMNVAFPQLSNRRFERTQTPLFDRDWF